MLEVIIGKETVKLFQKILLECLIIINLLNIADIFVIEHMTTINMSQQQIQRINEIHMDLEVQVALVISQFRYMRISQTTMKWKKEVYL